MPDGEHILPAAAPSDLSSDAPAAARTAGAPLPGARPPASAEIRRRAGIAGRKVLSLLTGEGGQADPGKTADPTWDSEQVICDGDKWFDALIADLEKAAKIIDIETYIYARDALGERLSTALAAAAARGVAVRLLVDGVGAAPWVRPGGGALVRAGVAVRVWHPPLWVIFSPLRWPAIVLRRLWRASAAMRKLNRRDHRKVCVIDGQVAWVGSFNIDGRHLRSLHGDAAWRDCGARVSGGGVRFLERAFARAWRHAWRMGPRLTPPVPLLPLATAALGAGHSARSRRREGVLVRLNDGLRLRRRNHRDLIKRMKNAKKRVWITSAYFLPPPALLRALAAAAAAGADVRVLVPGNSDVVFMPWIAWAFAHKLAKLGVGMFEYTPGMIHAKTVVIDDWACVGSTNLNQRSWLHDFEADVVVTHAESRRILEQAFVSDLAHARRDGVGATRPSWQRLLGRIGLFFAYWL